MELNDRFDSLNSKLDALLEDLEELKSLIAPTNYTGIKIKKQVAKDVYVITNYGEDPNTLDEKFYKAIRVAIKMNNQEAFAGREFMDED